MSDAGVPTGAQGSGPSQGGAGTAQLSLATAQAGVRALNAIQQALVNSFPQSGAVTNSAGSSSGYYLTVTFPDGSIYKIELFDPS